MTKKKKGLLSIILLIFGFNLLNAENFNDLNFLMNKYRIKITVKELDKLKNMYEPGSHEYILLQKTENYFLNKFPVDTFGIYSRIKLHNVIENAENRLQRNYKNMENENKWDVLKADEDLNRIYLIKQKELEKLQKEQSLKKKTKQQQTASPQDQYMNLLKQYMPK